MDDVEQGQPPSENVGRFTLSKKRGKGIKQVAVSDMPDYYVRPSDNDVTRVPIYEEPGKTLEPQNSSEFDISKNAKHRHKLM